MNKEIKIEIPEGYEIDYKKSDLSTGKIAFIRIKEPELITYNEIATKLFKEKEHFYISICGDIASYIMDVFLTDANNSSTKEQLEAILALNKLANVAKYLNGDWLPKWYNNTVYTKYYIYLDVADNILNIESNTFYKQSVIYFKTEKLAKKAIEILGEDEIRKALTLNH